MAHILEPNGNPFYDLSYDTYGNETQRQSRALGYTNVTNFQYDELNRVTLGEQGTNNSQIFSRSSYQYDNLSRETASWRDEWGVTGVKGERFGYDPMNQLTSAVYKADNVWAANPPNAARTVGYNYTPDSLNRQSMTDNGVVTTYSPSAVNQYQSLNGQTVGYDDNFNLTSMPGFGATYNAINQLTSATTSNGNSAEFVYDGLGRCVKRTVNGTATLMVYDGWNAILEWDGAGNYRASNVFGARTDEILFRWDTACGGSIYKQDAHGNVVALLDMWGNILEKYSYDAFGASTVVSWTGTAWDDAHPRTASNYGNRFMFTGREWIAELGIYDYRNRMYHPGLGRFLQTDPTGFDAGDMNLFRYCGDDPVDGSDPTGLDTTIVGVPIPGGDGMMRWTVTPETGKSFNFISNVFGNASSTGRDPYGQNGPLPPGDYRTSLYNSPKFGTTVIKLYSDGEGNEPTAKNQYTATIVHDGQKRKDLEFHPYRNKSEKRPTDKEVAKAEKDSKTREKLNKEFAESRSEGCLTVKQRDLERTADVVKKTEGAVIVRKFGY